MKLIDDIIRQPVRVAFGRSPGDSGDTTSIVALDSTRDADSVTITADDGSFVVIPGATETTAGVLTAADKVAIADVAGTLVRNYASRAAVSGLAVPAGPSALRTAGHAAPGDGGAALYRRAAGEPTHPGKVQSADGAWWELTEPRVFAEMLGALPDGFTSDLSAALADAVESASREDRQHLFLGPGRFRGDLLLSHAGGEPLSLEGTYQGTALRAAGDLGWALRVPATSFVAKPYYTARIAKLALDGHGTDGIGRRRNGLFAPRRLDIQHLSIMDCLIGYLRTACYYGGAQFMHVLNCDVGMWIGTFAAGEETLGGLRDELGNPFSAQMPEPSSNANGHAGNVRYSDGTARGSRFGVVIGGETEGTNPMIEFENYTIESNQVGMVVTAGDVTLDKVWFEANGTSGSETLNGHSYPCADLVVDGQYGKANQAAKKIATARLKRCITRRVVIGDNARVIFDDDTQLHQPPEIVGRGSATFNRIQMDNIFLPHVVERPRPKFGSQLDNGYAASGRGCACYARHKNNRIWAAQPKGGEILVADDFTATGFQSPKLATTGSPTVAWPSGTSFGIFDSNRCLRLTHNADFDGLSADFSTSVTDGYFYVLLMAIKPNEDIVVGFTNGWQKPNGLQMPRREWNTLAVLAPLDSTTVAGPTLIRVSAVSAAYPFNVHYSGIQIAKFAGVEDAAEFCAGNDFYVKEA